MIRRSQGMFWLAVQIAVAASGALAALWSWPAGVLGLIVLLPLNALALRRAWQYRQQPQQNQPLANAIAVTALVLFMLTLASEGLLAALVVLLTLTVLAMNVQLTRWRSYHLAQLVSFILLLAGAAEATSGAYLLVMTLYCVAAAFAFSEAWLDRESDGEPVPGPARSRQLQVGLLTMAVALLIYLLLPRPEALNWGAQNPASGDFYHNDSWHNAAREQLPDALQRPGSERTDTRLDDYRDQRELSDLSAPGGEGYRYDGLSGQLDIRSTNRSGSLDLHAVVARMQAAQGTYLKVRSYDTFDGVSWTVQRDDLSRKLKTSRTGQAQIRAGAEGNFRQIITLERAMPAWLPAAADVVAVWVPSSVVALDVFGQPLLPGTLQPGLRYTVQSQVQLFDGRPLTRGPQADASDRQLPAGLDPRIRELAQQVTAAGSDAYQRAVLLEQHLRTAYAYSFASITESQGQTPLAEFLFEDKQGHCEYFASAMTIMLRTLDIPARLVTGFSATTRNPLTGYFDIRAIDGHAWTEAWIDGRWVTFEPTAYYQLPQPEHSRVTAAQISRYAEAMLKREQQGDGAESLSIVGLIATVWLWLYTGMTLVLAWLKLLLLTLWPLLALAAVLGLLLWLTQAYWLHKALARLSLYRLQRYEAQEARPTLMFCLHHLDRVGQGRGIVRQPSQLAADWLQQLQQLSGPDPAYAQLTALLEALVYRDAEVDATQLQALTLTLARHLLR